MPTLVDEILHGGDGASASFADSVRSWCMKPDGSQPVTFRVHSLLDYGLAQPQHLPRAWLETSADGQSWTPLGDISLVPGRYVSGVATLAAGDDLRLAWTFTPDDETRLHWSIRVTIGYALGSTLAA
jgi:hypothetical protein